VKISSVFKKVSLEIENWVKSSNNFFEINPVYDNSILTLSRGLAICLYNGWQCDWMMNSVDRDIVYNGTKLGLTWNKHRNTYLEIIEQFYYDIQKNGTSITGESLAMNLDKCFILYLKILNSEDKNIIKTLKNQLRFVLKSSDNLYSDLISGKRNIIVFSHLKEYMK